MQIKTIRKYREALSRLKGDEIRCLIESFCPSNDHPLNLLAIVANSVYREKGVRKSQVMKQLREHPRFRTFSKLYEAGVVSANVTPEKFLEIVEKGLRK